MKYIKKFDEWNNIKKITDDKPIPKDFYFRSAEIWWCSIGINVGVETDGKNDVFERPVLIIKVFNKDMLWVVPITSSIKRLEYYYSFIFNKTKYSINTTQIRNISTKRLLRKVGTIKKNDYIKIMEILIKILKNETPTLSGGISEPEGDNEISIA